MLDGGRERTLGGASRRSDEQLAGALLYELGIYGGFCGRNSLSVAHHGAGQKNLASWEIHNTVTDPPA